MNSEAAQFLIEQNNETLRFLIEQKTTYLNSVVNVCMLWWVSSIVFYGSILAAMWLKQTELKKWLKQDAKRKVLNIGLLKGALLGFFLATALFGVAILFYSFPIQSEISALATKLGYEGNYFYNEMWGFRVAMSFGIGSFFFVCFIWHRFWLHLQRQAE